MFDIEIFHLNIDSIFDFSLPRWLSLVERETCNLVVAGSIPVRGFICFDWYDLIHLYDLSISSYDLPKHLYIMVI